MSENSSIDEIKKMQAEAIKRVKEMHSRSKPAPLTELNKKKSDDERQTNKKETKKTFNTLSHKQNNCKHEKFPVLIDMLFSDSDKSLLIVLIILLMDDKENFSVVLVLLYLLM